MTRRPSLLVRLSCCLAAGLAGSIALPARAQNAADPPPGEYRVVDGKVDPGTYTGWRLFHTACYGCHGTGATGTDLAPNLVERIKTLTPRAFATKVLTSYRIALPADDAKGDSGAMRDAMIEEVLRKQRGPRSRVSMPAWDADPLVNPHVLDLFAYLSARADGKLGPEEPTVLTGKKR